MTRNEIRKEYGMTMDEALEQCMNDEIRMHELKTNNGTLNIGPVPTFLMMARADELIDGVVCYVEEAGETYMVLDGRWVLFGTDAFKNHATVTVTKVDRAPSRLLTDTCDGIHPMPTLDYLRHKNYMTDPYQRGMMTEPNFNEVPLSGSLSTCTLSELNFDKFDNSLTELDNSLKELAEHFNEFWMSWEVVCDQAPVGPKIMVSRSAEYEASMQMAEAACIPPPAPGRKRFSSR